MEAWNDGIMEWWKKQGSRMLKSFPQYSILPVFHYSHNLLMNRRKGNETMAMAVLFLPFNL
jgi:hypothetical protein